ncbi:MAG TPA: NlpC/P60 family protein [Propionibacteriaceae bacterium]
MTSRLRVTVIGLSSMALTTAIFAIPAGLPAAADPALTVAEAKAQIDQLETDAAAIDQDYAGVQDQIDQGKAKLVQKQADVKAQTVKVAQMKLQVGQVALAKFQNRDLDTAAQLFFTEDTEGFLSQISTVEKVSDNQNTVLQNFQDEQANLADLEHSNETDLAALEAKEAELKTLRASSDKKVADAKAVLAKLTSAEQEAIAAEKKKAAAEAAAAAEGGVDPTTDDTSALAGSTRGAKALAFAKKQLGKPYRFGATGPGSYDCSGLTGAAWRAAGVSLSRTSQTQFHDGRAVSKSELQPGDLVFFYSSTRPTHVALYAGNGMVIHAPKPGSSVSYIKMQYMPFTGARRPG